MVSFLSEQLLSVYLRYDDLGFEIGRSSEEGPFGGLYVNVVHDVPQKFLISFIKSDRLFLFNNMNSNLINQVYSTNNTLRSWILYQIFFIHITFKKNAVKS